MDYGEIFVGTFRTIWRHKVLWVFGMLGRLLVTLAGIAAGVLALQLLPSWLSYMESLMTSGGNITLPPEPAQRLGALWFGLACAGLLGWLINYVVNLIMRGATIHEARMAWEGRATDAGRGLRAGAGRAFSLFVIDLIWWIPMVLLGVLLFIGGFVALVGGAAGVGGQNNPNGAAGAVFLGLFALCCCMFLVVVGFAVLYGVFSPLMYQGAVWAGGSAGSGSGPRTVGEAVGQGWRLARAHFGAMFIFWLLLIGLSVAGWALLAAINYPVSAATSGGLAAWMSSFFEDLANGVTAPPPPMPGLNSGLLAIATIVQAVLGLLIYGFLQAFGLAMYAEVYRRLTGGLPDATGASGLPPSPAAWQTRPGGFAPTAPETPEGGEGGVHIYDQPSGSGLSVPDEPPPGEENRPIL